VAAQGHPLVWPFMSGVDIVGVRPLDSWGRWWTGRWCSLIAKKLTVSMTHWMWCLLF